MPKIKPPWCSIISLSLLHLYTSSPPKTILTTTPFKTSRVVQLIYFLTISCTLLNFFTEHSLHLLTWYIILWETCYSLRTPYPWFSSLLQGHILRHTPYIMIELSQCFPCSLILLSDNYPCSFVAYVISFLQPPLTLHTIYQSLGHFSLFISTLGTQLTLLFSGQTVLLFLNSTF